MEAPNYCNRCNAPVHNLDVHKIANHPGLKDYSFIISMEEHRNKLAGQDGKSLAGKYLWFYGDDPARDRDFHGIVINGLPARKTDKWLPRLRDVFRFQNRNYIETLEFLAKDLFKKMPPTRYTVDASNNPAYAELLERKLGTNKLVPLKFGNSGTTNTKYDLKVIGKQYIKLGYEFPDPDYLLRQRMVTPDKADLLRILKDEALREMAILTESDRISFEHPLGKHNDMVHAWEMSLKGVMEYQKNNFGVSFQAISMMHGASHETAATETPIQRAEAGLMGRLKSLGVNIKEFRIDMPDSSQN